MGEYVIAHSLAREFACLSFSADRNFWPLMGEYFIAHSLVREFVCLSFSADRNFVFAGSTTGDVAVFQIKAKQLT
ncbi:hypothetical protein T484DRAFT_1796494 [Baffinella frigidus]|nr:hypothetical protein T484DRAFT_1796494 [Cryptophyta sp. CCMP2293]